MQTIDLDAPFAALADPTRRAILARLCSGEASVMELAAPFKLSQPAISRHLKVLESAGLIARRVDKTRRPCRVVPDAVDELTTWLTQLRISLEANYARLDQLLAQEDEIN
ncbi:MAG: winged helix-turn-helix transcriptional regulator [Armatimonadetes bacterium]|nr:winged helix-turn-helix transcriptional regulator [Armatimonadota bacterium]